MKIHFIFSLLLLSGLTANCQNATAITNSHPTLTTTDNPKGFASPGCWELGGSISFTSTSYSYQNSASSSNPPLSMLLFAPYFGYFPIQGFELGVNPLSISSTNEYSITKTSLLFVFAPSYNFNTHSKVFPFVEGDIGYNSTNETSSSTISGMCYGGRFGFKFAIVSHALFTFAAQYLVQSYALPPSSYGYSPSGSTEESLNNFVVGAGFSVYL